MKRECVCTKKRVKEWKKINERRKEKKVKKEKKRKKKRKRRVATNDTPSRRRARRAWASRGRQALPSGRHRCIASADGEGARFLPFSETPFSFLWHERRKAARPLPRLSWALPCRVCRRLSSSASNRYRMSRRARFLVRKQGGMRTKKSIIVCKADENDAIDSDSDNIS